MLFAVYSSVVRSFIDFYRLDRESLIGKTVEQVMRKVFGCRPEWQYLQRKPFAFECGNRFGLQGPLFYEERVIEEIGFSVHGFLENAEIEYHVAHCALFLKFFLGKRYFNAPSMPMEVLALSVVVGQEMR